jgi:hypothetical protein
MCTSDDSTHTVNGVVSSIAVGGGGVLPEDELLDLLASPALLLLTLLALLYS